MLKIISKLVVKRSVTVSLLCLSFIAGVVIGKWVSFVSIWVVLYVLPFFLFAPRHRIVAFIAACMLLLLLGVWRGSNYATQLARYDILNGREVSLMVVATSDAVYGSNSQISFDARKVQLEDGQKLVGLIQVNGFGETMVYEGDTVRVAGKIFRARGNSVARVSFAKLHVVSRGSSPIAHFRRKFTAGLQSSLPEPMASFAMGLLVGQRNTLPPDISTQLQMVGLTHIIAVSGYNLTIIMRAVKKLSEKRSKYQYVLLSCALVGCFLLITGSSPSIVRASVVCGLSLATWYYGRELAAVPLLLLAACVTAAATPMYAWNNVSWMLSFLAFFGVLVIAPIFTKRLFGQREPPLLLAIVVESLAAEVMTVPYVLLIFGQMSLVATFANVLVGSVIPLAMLLSFIAGFAGMFAPALAGIIAWPASLLLTYMLDTVRLLSGIPHAFVQNVAFSFCLMCVSYIFLASLCVIAWHKAYKNDIITETN